MLDFQQVTEGVFPESSTTATSYRPVSHRPALVNHVWISVRAGRRSSFSARGLVALLFSSFLKIIYLRVLVISFGLLLGLPCCTWGFPVASRGCCGAEAQVCRLRTVAAQALSWPAARTSQTRDRTTVSCTDRQILNPGTVREAHPLLLQSLRVLECSCC